MSRRMFLGASGLAAATVAAGTAGIVGLEPLIPGGSTAAADFTPFPDTYGPGTGRREQSYQVRVDAAQYNRGLPIPTHPTNGDEERYPTKIGNYTKALPHNGYGEVDLSAYQSLVYALGTGRPADFNAIQLGGGRHLVNPQSGLAFDLEGTDSHQIFAPATQSTTPPVALPPAPALASAEIA
ncbi:MAG TPA: twin-arginine translocation pathway signal protein, partial [Thermoanaerobaculia bacterium]|nr:twin-arginine translocation pathway signal protein [Thermoanaerobaculia bacterium]